MNKIFGIGLSKTGTTSLAAALGILGYRITDNPTDERTIYQLRQGDYQLDVLETCDGITDTPAALSYQQLDKLFPGSKFILTERNDVERWLKSAEAHWARAATWRSYFPSVVSAWNFMDVAVYGLETFNADRFRSVYEQHSREVRRYFEGRLNDLLVMDIAAGDGWPELVSFLGKLEPSIPFPHKNAAKSTVIDFGDDLLALEEDLRRYASTGSKVFMLDQQGAFMARQSREFECFPFVTREDGSYAGTPGSDEQMLDSLERLPKHGDVFVCVWMPDSAWCFTSYPRWAEAIHKKFDLLNPECGFRLYRRNATH